jgi:hypothetical protein
MRARLAAKSIATRLLLSLLLATAAGGVALLSQTMNWWWRFTFARFAFMPGRPVYALLNPGGLPHSPFVLEVGLWVLCAIPGYFLISCLPGWAMDLVPATRAALARPVLLVSFLGCGVLGACAGAWVWAANTERPSLTALMAMGALIAAVGGMVVHWRILERPIAGEECNRSSTV